MNISPPVAAIVALCFLLAGFLVGASSFEQTGAVWAGSSVITWILLSVMFLVPMLSLVMSGDWLSKRMASPAGKSMIVGTAAGLSLLILIGTIQFARTQGMFTMPAPCAELFTLRPVIVIGAGMLATCFPLWTMIKGTRRKAIAG